MNRSLLAVFSFTLFLFCAGHSLAQTRPPFMGMGDSLGEGVQSGNAFSQSQPQSYLNLTAAQAGFPFQQPLLSTSPVSFVGLGVGRSRLDSTLVPADVAVSGATVSDVINEVASKTGAGEQNLVLPPYYGVSQLQIVEHAKPGLVFVWVGNDDLIPYILSFTHLDNPTGVTSLSDFTASYQQLMSRLKATGAQVVVGNIPDLTKVAFLFDNDDVTKYTGTNYNLPVGYRTTLGAVILLKLGALTGPDLSTPAYSLSPAQITNIQAQTTAFNQVISDAAKASGFPVVDAYKILNTYITNPLTIEGVTITTHFNGGAFSLDGIHPSNIGYAIFANAFINTANAAFHRTIPPISSPGLVQIFNADPFVDFDGDGLVPGRPRTGLLETFAPFLGFAGKSALASRSAVDPGAFMREYQRLAGKNPDQPWSRQDLVGVVRQMLGDTK